MVTQKQAQLRIILACRELRCAWDMNAAWFQKPRPSDGLIVWERTMECLRGCTSTRTDRVLPYTWERAEQPMYNRPELWKNQGGTFITEIRGTRIQKQRGYRP